MVFLGIEKKENMFSLGEGSDFYFYAKEVKQQFFSEFAMATCIAWNRYICIASNLPWLFTGLYKRALNKIP